MPGLKQTELLLCAALLAGGSVLAEEGSDAGIAPGQLDWLIGCWSGEGFGGRVEECWLAADDGQMSSVFQVVKDGKQSFSELVTINQVEGVTALRVKHFSRDFEQWPSDQGRYISFALESVGEQSVQFDGLAYSREADVITVNLDMKQRDGSVKTITYTMARMD